MPEDDIVKAVIQDFLSKLELEGRLDGQVVGRLKKLADEGSLSDEDAVKAALKEASSPDDQTEDD